MTLSSTAAVLPARFAPNACARIAAAAMLLVSLPGSADVLVVDTFDADNPNQWGWTNNGGSVYVLQPSGGNPGGWIDSGSGYFADHPNLTAIPPAGSELRRALASASLLTVSFDFQRLDPGCFPQNNTDGTFALELIDLHSDTGGAVISAHVAGPRSPARPSHWHGIRFDIPSDSAGVPPGWVLVAPAGLAYGWRDLMRNIDGIRLFSLDPDDVTFSACWRLGVDNVTVGYGEHIFADGFDTAP